jgi:hypothetical protein
VKVRRGVWGKTERKRKRGEKKRWVKVSKKAWGKIMKETCNFDLFYDLWTGPAGEINKSRRGTARESCIVLLW